MKLSEIKGVNGFSAIISLIGPVSRIAADERAGNLFRRERLPQGKTAREFLWDKIAKSIPALLNDYRNDFCEIMSVTKGISPEEYAENVSAPQLLSDIFGLLNDEEMFSLFFLAQPEVATSGATPENITESKV